MKSRLVVMFLLFFNMTYADQEYGHVFIYTMPKTGTHLIKKLFYLANEFDGYSVNPINPFKDELNPSQRKLIQYRDLRDMFVSYVYFLDMQLTTDTFRGTRTPLVKKSIEKWNSATFDEKLLALIEDSDDCPYGRGWMQRFMDAIYRASTSPNTLITRFEHLVGSKGNGDDELQIVQIKEILTFWGLEKTDDEILKIGNDLHGIADVKRFPDLTHSFRTGQIGEWKTHFNEDNIRAFKERYGDYLIYFGYEEDNNW